MSARLIVCLLLAISLAACKKQATFVKIDTGAQTGVYYPTGEAIAKMVNDQREQYGIQVSVASSQGSVFNVNALLTGDTDFGIVQSDIQYQAVRGEGEWAAGGPRDKLRAVFSIHPELVTLVASAEAGIATLADLKGKRVNLDSPASGTRQNALQVFRAIGLDPATDLHAQELGAKEAPSLLQDDRIDAFFYTAAHPNGALKEASSRTDQPIRFIPIAGPEIDQLVAASPYLTKMPIPLEHYPNAKNEGEVWTIAVKATLMTTADTPEAVVYAITREVFENLDAFKQLHPAYAVLTRENMLEGLSAPIHPGAMRYYREAGLAERLGAAAK